MTTTDANMPVARGRETTARGVSRPADEGQSKASGSAVGAAGDGGVGLDGVGVPAGAGEQAVGRRPSFTITDAAVACVVSRKTITRKLPELATHGAAKDADGIWRIPVEALLAVGLHPGRSMPTERRAAETLDLRQGGSSEPAPPRSTGPELITIPRDRWDDVRIRLARAEAEAAERGLALADARLALRALSAAPSSGQPPVAPEPSWPGAWHPSASAASSPSAAGGVPSTPPAPAGFSGQVPENRAVDPGSEGQTAPAEQPGAAQTWDASPHEAQVVPTVTVVETESSLTATQPADLFTARSRAARSGQVVPVILMPGAAGAGSVAKPRRWWQSR